MLASICWGIALVRMDNMLGVVACAFNPSTGKAVAGWFLWVPGQLELHNEKLPQAKQTNNNHKKGAGDSLRNLGWHLLYPSILNYLSLFFTEQGVLTFCLPCTHWLLLFRCWFWVMGQTQDLALARTHTLYHQTGPQPLHDCSFLISCPRLLLFQVLLVRPLLTQ